MRAGPGMPGPIDASGVWHQLPLTWCEVDAFARSTALLSEPWELELLRDMSKLYLRAKGDGKDVLAMSPVEQNEGLND